MQNLPNIQKKPQQKKKKQANEQGNGNMSFPETHMLAYFFQSDSIFLDAIFRRCESILNILRRNNKGTKTQPMFSETEIPINEFGT